MKGPNAHPFYKWAAEARPKDVPRWNFHKYLIGRDGYIADVFPESVEPADTRVKTAIARALAERLRTKRLAIRAVGNASKTTHLLNNPFGDKSAGREPLPWRARSN